MKVGEMQLCKNIHRDYMEFYIKENYKSINALSEMKYFEVKPIIFMDNGVELLIISFRFNKCDDLVYYQVFDRCNKENRIVLESILFEDKIRFKIIDIEGKVQIKVSCQYRLLKIISEYLKINKSIKWTQEMSKVARQNLEFKYPNKNDLFNLQIVYDSKTRYS